MWMGGCLVPSRFSGMSRTYSDTMYLRAHVTADRNRCTHGMSNLLRRSHHGQHQRARPRIGGGRACRCVQQRPWERCMPHFVHHQQHFGASVGSARAVEHARWWYELRFAHKPINLKGKQPFLCRRVRATLEIYSTRQANASHAASSPSTTQPDRRRRARGRAPMPKCKADRRSRTSRAQAPTRTRPDKPSHATRPRARCQRPPQASTAARLACVASEHLKLLKRTEAQEWEEGGRRMGAPGVCVGAFASIRQARERMCAEASLHTSRLCEPSSPQVSRVPPEVS